jgi:hypothetical protein
MSHEDESDDDYMTSIVLTDKDVLNRGLEKPLSQTKFGGKGVVEKDHVTVRIGQRPIVRSLRELYERAGKALPPDLQVFSSFRLWMITHVVSVVREESGIKDINRLIYEAQFGSDVEVTTVQVLPQTEFIKKFSVDGRTSWAVDVGLGVNGQVTVPAAITELLGQTDIVSFDGKLKAKIDIANSVSVVGNLSFSVTTPKVVAVGVGSDYCRWEFTKHDVPLIGDHLMIQILLVPKHTPELAFQSRVSVTTAIFDFLPSTRRSQWTDLMARLPRGK